LSGYRGISTSSIANRVLSFSGLAKAFKDVYRGFWQGFFGNFYLSSTALRTAYVLLAALFLLFMAAIAVKHRIYRQPLRLALIIALTLLVPLACNFSVLFSDGRTALRMIYAIVLVFALLVAVAEMLPNSLAIFKSILIICLFFVVGHFIISNNVYYLRVYYANQQTNALATQILTEVVPLVPLSASKQITYFGGVPNEHYTEPENFFRRYGSPSAASLGTYGFVNMQSDAEWQQNLFAQNIRNLHGVNLSSLPDGPERDRIRTAVLDSEMPTWPFAGSVAVIDDVIVVNFGMADIVRESDAEGQYFRARHWQSGVYDEYEYSWEIFLDREFLSSSVTASDRLYYERPSIDNRCYVFVTVRNTATGFEYRQAGLLVAAGEE
jgi:hypothetical protein